MCNNTCNRVNENVLKGNKYILIKIVLEKNWITNVLVATRDVLKDKKLKFFEYPGDIHIFSHFVIRVKVEKIPRKMLDTFWEKSFLI